ncbi:hypothetical protein C7M84_019508, partial [Penaeus vannamei]
PLPLPPSPLSPPAFPSPLLTPASQRPPSFSLCTTLLSPPLPSPLNAPAHPSPPSPLTPPLPCSLCTPSQRPLSFSLLYPLCNPSSFLFPLYPLSPPPFLLPLNPLSPPPFLSPSSPSNPSHSSPSAPLPPPPLFLLPLNPPLTLPFLFPSVPPPFLLLPSLSTPPFPTLTPLPLLPLPPLPPFLLPLNPLNRPIPSPSVPPLTPPLSSPSAPPLTPLPLSFYLPLPLTPPPFLLPLHPSSPLPPSFSLCTPSHPSPPFPFSLSPPLPLPFPSSGGRVHRAARDGVEPPGGDRRLLDPSGHHHLRNPRPPPRLRAQAGRPAQALQRGSFLAQNLNQTQPPDTTRRPLEPEEETPFLSETLRFNPLRSCGYLSLLLIVAASSFTIVWLWILAMMGIMGPLIYLIILLRVRLCRGDPTLTRTFPLDQCVWFVFGAMMKQGSVLSPISDSSRILFATWWLFITIVTSFYTANLTAYLTFNSLVLPIEKAEDLAKYPDIKWVAFRDGALADIIMVGMGYGGIIMVGVGYGGIIMVGVGMGYHHGGCGSGGIIMVGVGSGGIIMVGVGMGIIMVGMGLGCHHGGCGVWGIIMEHPKLKVLRDMREAGRGAFLSSHKEALDLVRGGKHVYIDDMRILDYLIQEDFKARRSKGEKDQCHFYATPLDKDKDFIFWYGYAFRKNSEYKDLFDGL